MASARAKAEQAQQAAVKAQSDADKGRVKAYGYDPNFVQPGAFFFPAHRFLPVPILFEYFGRVTRHNSLEKDVVLGTMPGTRRQGGQRRQWLDNITQWTEIVPAWRKIEMGIDVSCSAPPTLVYRERANSDIV